MLAGERRPVSGRRGMTVLGKVPKPVNLPSQRLENRGLDPNVEIVPRGSVSWGAAGSPPTSASPWGNSAQSSSPPVSSGPWGGAPPRPSTAGSSGSATASSGPGAAGGGGPWGGHPPRPSSAGSGTRPLSAGSLRQTQETVAAANAWGPATARPSSASGVLGQAQPQSPAIRPRSAETRTTQAPALTRFAEQTNGPPAPSPGAWGGAGAGRKLGEEPHQPARFTLTRVDFPTLGSEKNPDLRPQQNKTGGTAGDRTASVDERVPPTEERPPSGPNGPYEEPPPTSPGAYGGQERVPEGWRREARPYGGHPGMADGNWHRDGPAPMPPYSGGQQQVADTWRREPGHGAGPGGGPSDDNWRRGGPPVGPYGPPGPARFQPDPGYMHQRGYGLAPGPGPYGRSGPGGYGRPGDVYGNTAPFGRPGAVAPPRPGPPMGPGMYQSPGPYDNYYGPPGPGYGNMDDREMMMLGMNGPPGMYGSFPQGPPPEAYGRYPLGGGPGPGPRHMPNNMGGINRDRNDSTGYEGEGYRDGPKFKDSVNFKDGGGYNDGGSFKEGGRMSPYRDPGESRRGGHAPSGNLTNEMQRPSSRGGQHGSHRDWGAAASSDEPMDFSKPVFEEEISSASPGPSNKTSQSEPAVERDPVQTSRAADHLQMEDSPEGLTEGVVVCEEANGSEIVQAPQSSGISEGNHLQIRKQKDVESGGAVAKGRVEENSLLETKDQTAKKVQVSKGRVEDISLLETKDPLAKKAQVSESSESTERRWGKAQSRERSFGREPVFSPHGGRAVGSKKETNPAITGVGGPAVTASQRPGLPVSGRSNSRPTTPSVTQGPMPTAETIVTEDSVSPPAQEKHMLSCDPTSPSGSDGQKDKVRILKRVGEGPDSPHSDIVNISETSYSEVSISSTTAETMVKDDIKPKVKTSNNHEGEKEWRPKVSPIADATTEVPKLSSNIKSSTGGPSVAGGATEKIGTADAGNLSNVDSYDYEAQRARMKEIAAQRAIQLRKEEDERIKEQKAKALAKLEELNRRSLVASVSPPAEEAALDQPTEEPAVVIVQTEETEVISGIVEEVPVIESSPAVTGANTPRGSVRNGKNEHGKRERVGDRKSNGRSREEHRVKMGTGEQRELTKPRTAALSSQVKSEPPLLPPPSQQVASSQSSVISPPTGHATTVQQDPGVPSSETSGSLGGQMQQQVPPKVQESRHRGKQAASQSKQGSRQLTPSLETDHPAQGQVIASDITEKAGGWNSPLDLDPKEVTLSLGSVGVSTDGATTARKKKVKNGGRNKQKPESLTLYTDPTSTVDAHHGWNVDLSSSNESGTEAGKPTPKVVPTSGGDEVVKAGALPVSQKDLVSQDPKSEFVGSEQASPVEVPGSDGGSLRSNGEVPSRRPQRKSQLARERRVPARERGTSQDVRVGDKPHGGEGMIWAPVRSPSSVNSAGPKGGFGLDATIADTAVVDKKEESVVATQTGGRARRAELERYTPKPVVKQQAQQQEEMQQQQVSSVSLNQRNDSVNVPSTTEAPQNSSSLTEIKFGSEARQADASSKQSRAHTSWRQRSSGGERSSAHKETNQTHHAESIETGGKSQQPSSSNNSQHNYHRSRPQSASSEQSRPGSSHQARDVGRNHPSSAVAEKEQQNLEVLQQGRSGHPSSSTGAPAATEREPKNVQEGVIPYQPPRPGSGQKIRGLESDVQSSHEHVKSHRTNVSQMDRQHGKYDRDHHGVHERGPGHQMSRSQNFRQLHSSGSHDREQSQIQSGSLQQPRSVPLEGALEGASSTRGKDQQNPHAVGVAQGRPASQSLPEKNVSTEREQSQTDHQQQPRSPPRHRSRQHAATHEREQAPASHVPQQSRYRQSGHERDHQREVPNAVHHQQHQRGATDGQWQQTGGAPTDRIHASTDLGHSNEHTTRSTFHKSQVAPGGTVEKDHPPTQSSSHQHSTRSDPQNKLQGPAPNETQKHPQYQPVSQHQRPQQQSSQGPKGDNTHGSSHWNGEWPSSAPVLRGREHGNARRGRFGSRFSGPGRGGDIEHRREQLPKQRLPIDAAGGAVPSQVGG